MAAAPSSPRKASATSTRPAAPRRRNASASRPARRQHSAARSAISAARPIFGRDLNGDGDRLDTVRVLAPSQTQTNRYGVIAGLRYDINEFHTVRVNYTFDRGRHRQTGETGLLQPNGEPFDVFPVNDPLADVSGNILQKRDRRSIALLHQISGEYRGEFFDSRLTVNIGVRGAVLHPRPQQLLRHLERQRLRRVLRHQHRRPRRLAGQQPDVVGTPAAGVRGQSAPVQGPQRRVFHYNEILPNVGAVYDIAPRTSIFANYSRGLQVPSTDLLYNSFFYPDRRRAGPAGAGDDRQFRCRRPLPVEHDRRPRLRSGTRSSRTGSPRPMIRTSTRTCSATSAPSTNTASTPASPGRRRRACSSMSTAPTSGRRSRTTFSPASARQR